jgi:hypothetical protein
MGEGRPAHQGHSLSRNFSFTILHLRPVLIFATGDAVVVVDADLQQPLPVMHEMMPLLRRL